MRVVISQIDKVLFQGEGEALIVPGKDGEMTILPGHVPLVSPLRKGTVTVVTVNNERKSFPVTEGFIECSGGTVTVLL